MMQQLSFSPVENILTVLFAAAILGYLLYLLVRSLRNRQRGYHTVNRAKVFSKRQATAVNQPVYLANGTVNSGVTETENVKSDRPKGEVVEQYEPAEYKTLLSESDASVLQEYMRYVVEEGTATKLKSDSYEAAGKTGSAEFSSSSDATHSWFVGYAHNGEEPDIAVAVIVENSGVGSEYAVPIAKQIFDAYYTWEN